MHDRLSVDSSYVTRRTRFALTDRVWNVRVKLSAPARVRRTQTISLVAIQKIAGPAMTKGNTYPLASPAANTAVKIDHTTANTSPNTAPNAGVS